MFTSNREQLFKHLGNGVALVSSAKASHGRFRQDPNFWFLTGFDEPGAAAVFHPSSDDPFALFVRPKDALAEIWDGLRAGPDKAKEETAASSSFDAAELEQVLFETCIKADALWVIGGQNDELVGRITARLRIAKTSGVGPDVVIRDLGSVLAEMRVIKSSDEISLISKACEVTAFGHAAVAGSLAKINHEYEAQALIEAEFTRRGATPSFTTIVAAGANACVLHYIANRDAIKNGDLLLVDCGAELKHYCGDVTRTYQTAKPTDAQRRVYEIVVAANEAAIDLAKPGVTLEDIHDTARSVIIDGLVDLDVLPKDAKKSFQMEHDVFHFPHGTSHFLGMDVHDVGATRTQGVSRRLEPGMVITIEPGLYFAPDRVAIDYPLVEIDRNVRWELRNRIGLQKAREEAKRESEAAEKVSKVVPESLRGIGVRIEDDILITEDGCRNLTAQIPKSLTDLGW